MNRNLKAAAALLVLTLALASCGGSGPDQPGGPGKPGNENPASTNGDAAGGANNSAGNGSQGKEKKSALAYSRCMRSHGVKNFPDPDDSGQIKLHAEPGNGLEFNDPTFQKADKTCKPLMPGPSKEQKAQQRKAALKFAQCMRAHGVREFPDPPAGEGPLVQKGGPGSENLNPGNPAFAKAEKACAHLAAAGGGEHGLSSQDGK